MPSHPNPCATHFFLAAFDYRFGALDNVKSEVSAAYDNLLYVSAILPSFALLKTNSHHSADSVLAPAMWNTVFRTLWSTLR